VKCSNCSHEVRPVVAIDIDGTLADYHDHFLNFAVKWLGHKYTKPRGATAYDGTEPHREWFTRTMSVDVTTFRMIKLAFRQGGMKRTMPIYRESVKTINDIRDLGVEVWLTTTRPWERFDRVDPDTRHWLSEHRIEFDGLIYDDDKMAALAERVDPLRVVAVVDDLTEVLDEANDLFPNAVTILRKTIHNRGVAWPREGYMGSIFRWIDESIVSWRSMYEQEAA
jgi:FMN phosphatase YigB (HAD superfamily)